MNEQIYSCSLAADVALLRTCLNKTLADMHRLIHHPDNAIPTRFYDDESHGAEDHGDTEYEEYGEEEKKSGDTSLPQRPEK